MKQLAISNNTGTLFQEQHYRDCQNYIINNVPLQSIFVHTIISFEQTHSFDFIHFSNERQSAYQKGLPFGIRAPRSIKRLLLDGEFSINFSNLLINGLRPVVSSSLVPFVSSFIIMSITAIVHFSICFSSLIYFM